MNVYLYTAHITYVIHDDLTEYLNVHDLIYKNQPGFRKQFSTETALAYIAKICKPISLKKF